MDQVTQLHNATHGPVIFGGTVERVTMLMEEHVSLLPLLSLVPAMEIKKTPPIVEATDTCPIPSPSCLRALRMQSTLPPGVTLRC